MPRQISPGQPPLSFVQRLVRLCVSTPTFSRFEAESRDWRITCTTCGNSASIWDIGGIRAGASGTPRSLRHCGTCNRRTSHQIHRTGE